MTGFKKMEPVLQCSHCKATTGSSFKGIHICTGQELGCSEHKIKSIQFLEISSVLRLFSKCKLCLTDLMRVRLPDDLWIYDIDPQLYDWFVEVLSQYKWRWCFLNGTAMCLGKKSDKADKADKAEEQGDEEDGSYSDCCSLMDTLLKRDQLGPAEASVLSYLKSIDEDYSIIDWPYDWLDNIASKGVEFIKAMCQAYGPELDLRKFELGTLFCITCLNGYYETARWLATEYRDNIKIQELRVFRNHDRVDIPLVPAVLLAPKDYKIDIVNSRELLDYVMKCPLDEKTLKEVLDIFKEFFPEAFIVLESKGTDNISMLLYDHDQFEQREYDLKFAALSDRHIDLIGYCTDNNNHLGEQWLAGKIKWSRTEVVKAKVKKSFLPDDMIVSMVIPWKKAGLTVYYGDAGKPNYNTYIVIVRKGKPIYTYREGDCSFQCDDTDVYTSDNHMLIDNIGDVSSQILITYRQQNI